jgi:hypothetical protein
MNIPPDFESYDQADQAIVDSLNAQGIDTTQALPVSVNLGFSSEQIGRQAAMALVLARYPDVKVALTGVRPAPLLRLPSCITTVTVKMAPSLDAMRSMRIGLGEFANVRGGWFMTSGIDPGVSEAEHWSSFDLGANDQVTPDQVDQQLIDVMFAYDADLKKSTAMSTGLGFSTEDVARQAAAALIGGGYPAVRVIPVNAGWTVAVDAYLVPKLDAIRTLRLNLTTFAQSRGGSWVGCVAKMTMPKAFDDAPS